MKKRWERNQTQTLWVLMETVQAAVNNPTAAVVARLILNGGGLGKKKMPWCRHRALLARAAAA
jgi:hypothetical protein